MPTKCAYGDGTVKGARCLSDSDRVSNPREDKDPDGRPAHVICWHGHKYLDHKSGERRVAQFSLCHPERAPWPNEPVRKICLELQAYRTRERQRSMEKRWLQVPAVRAAVEATIDQIMEEGLPVGEFGLSHPPHAFFATRAEARAALEAKWRDGGE